MCKAPKRPEPKEPDKPEFLRNRYLDAAIGQSGIVNQIRRGRSDLRIRPDSVTSSRQIGDALSPAAPTGVSDPTSPSIGPAPIAGRRARILQ